MRTACAGYLSFCCIHAVPFYSSVEGSVPEEPPRHQRRKRTKLEDPEPDGKGPATRRQKQRQLQTLNKAMAINKRHWRHCLVGGTACIVVYDPQPLVYLRRVYLLMLHSLSGILRLPRTL
ncbi:hypothetical protein LZ32DRAFT_219018 [Colletotrichum eremochloae]|nr:hypothetical protein LZ32DRAFT_219018 [Colletotrichum eremochloae]